MKFNHIVRDSSADTFYIDNTSVTNSSPVIKLNETIVDILNESENLSSLSSYGTKDFNKIIKFEHLVELIEYFSTNQVNTKISNRLSFQSDLLTTYLTVDGTTVEYKKPPLIITESDIDVIRNWAIGFDYKLNITEEENSLREVSVSIPTGNVIFDRLESSTYNPRKDLNYNDTYELLETINSVWKKLKEELQLENNIELDTSLTYGNVMPVYSSIPFSPDYKVLSGTIIFEAPGDNQGTFKESFSISSKSTTATFPHSGIQVIWVSPDTVNSLVKIVWDTSIVEDAIITNLKASKT
jgi:hypothetical protein